uniref:DUF4336 domain-containing protein n=1 Tax=OCS116 cluster bacterium TaxID=2030921 RepID=A0A2A4YV28_9PROT
MIEKLDEYIWVKDSHFRALGCKGSIRMTIVKTSKGLLIYSPVLISFEEVEQINAIGEVFAIVAPNLFHHMYFVEFVLHFPNATCWVPEGLAEKVNHLPMHKNLDVQKPIFATNEVQQMEVNGHNLNETVFYHTASQTLITADFLYNYQAEQHWGEKIFFWLLGCYGKVAVPFYHALGILNKPLFSQSLSHIFKLPMRRVIMSHGRILNAENAEKLFEAAWAKILK